MPYDRPTETAIQALRRRLSGHTLSHVARISGCSYTTVHRIAAGHTHDVYTDTAGRLHYAMDTIEAGDEWFVMPKEGSDEKKGE